jgi:hypothetical protein
MGSAIPNSNSPSIKDPQIDIEKDEVAPELPENVTAEYQRPISNIAWFIVFLGLDIGAFLYGIVLTFLRIC